MFKRSDGRWEEQIRLPDGRRKSIYGSTKSELKKKLLEFNSESELGPTLSPVLESWYESREKDVSFKTLEGYRAPIKRLNEAFGSQRMQDITPAQVQAFLRDLASKGYKRTTVQRPLDVLRMVYDYQITQPNSVVRSNPCSSVRLPSGLSQQRRSLISPEDAEIVRSNVSHPFGLFAFLLMHSGLREGEALALTDSDITDTEIHVTKSLSWQPNRPVIKEPKTAASVRTVVLLSQLKAVLPKFRGFLFSSDGGKSPLTNTEFRSRWNGYCRDVGLADAEHITHRSSGANNRTYTATVWHNRIVPHQLRHEFATFCLDAGLDPIDASDLLGHASEATTRAVYTHIRESRRKTTATLLQQYIDSQNSENN